MTEKYEAILFDFDGVLVDSEPVHWDCWRQILLPYGIEIPWETYCQSCIGIADREMVSFLCSQADPPVDVDLLYQEYPRKKKMFREAMLGGYKISEEVNSLLARVHGEYKTAVVTSSGQTEVQPLLEAAGLLPHLDACVFGGDVQRLKPAPDPYLLAAERLGVKRALVVEDSQAGQTSGLAAGFDVLRVRTQSEVPAKLIEVLDGRGEVVSPTTPNETP